MGKYMRKAKITGEVAVMEVPQSSLGVRTRARTLALRNPTSACYLQLRSRRLMKPIILAEPKKPKESSCKENPNPMFFSGSVNSASVGSVSVSCSKKNGGAEVVSLTVPALEKEGSPKNEVCVEASFGENVLGPEGRERDDRETTPSNLVNDSGTLGTPGSTTRPTTSSVSNRRIRNTRCKNIPTTREMDDFFAGAEQRQQRIFVDKYNYDPVNDLPLPGRYEWLTLMAAQDFQEWQQVVVIANAHPLTCV